MKPFKVSKLISVDSSYHLFIAGASNESRATFAHKALSIKAANCYFIEYKVPASRRVKHISTYFQKATFKMVSSGIKLKELLRKVLLGASGKSSNICVDITCLSREDLGSIIETFSKWDMNRHGEIHFVYSLAKFSPPPDKVGPVMHLGPIIPYFSGWSSDPSAPTTLVLGLGYEPDLALGLMERLEPSRTFAFRPTGHDPRYTAAIEEKNSAFLCPTPKATVFDYSILDPFSTYTKLESMVYSELRDNRVVIAPFGLKSIALSSFLVAARYIPQVAIWGIKPEIVQKTEDREASGKWVGLKVKF